jgi:hypothetical protein
MGIDYRYRLAELRQLSAKSILSADLALHSAVPVFHRDLACDCPVLPGLSGLSGFSGFSGAPGCPRRHVANASQACHEKQGRIRVTLQRWLRRADAVLAA